MEKIKLKKSAISSLSYYIKDIEERTVLRLQIEFPNDHDLVKQIIENNFSNIYWKIEDLARPKMPNNLNI